MKLTYSRCLALAALVAVPSLFMGLFMDDYQHLLTVDRKLDIATPFDAFRFAGNPETVDKYIERGPFPWFTYPDIHLIFFRPLSSELMWLDRQLFGEQYWLYHLHSIAWYVALVALAGLLYRRYLGGAAMLAMALFALDEAHAIPADWWSNRNALVAAVPALAGLLAHIRWREDGWRWGLPLSLLGYAFGFTGGEVALGIMPYVGMYELLGRRDALVKRTAALAPAALLSIAYLGYYKWADYGVRGSGIYLDPISEFGDFIRLAPSRLLMLLANQFVTLPIEVPVGAPSLTGPLVAASMVVLALCAWLLRRAWREASPQEDRALLWMLAAAVLSTAPALATFPSGRLMTLPSLGTAPVIAMVLQWAWRHWDRKPLRWLSRGLLTLHVGVALLFWLALPLFLSVADARGNAALEASKLDEGEDLAQVRQIAINPPDPYHAMYPAVLGRFLGKAEPEGWNMLSMAPYPHKLTRVDERTLDLEWVDGEMLGTLFEKLVRSPKYPYQVGDKVVRGAFTAQILSMGKEGPNKVRFVFRAPLEDKGLAFYVWEKGRFVRYTPPAIGESELLEQTRGLFDPGFILGRPS